MVGGRQVFDFTPVGLSMGCKSDSYSIFSIRCFRYTHYLLQSFNTNTCTVWSATLDFVLAILLWHVIMGLKMKRKEKLTVAFGLSLGVLYVSPLSPILDLF